MRGKVLFPDVAGIWGRSIIFVLCFYFFTSDWVPHSNDGPGGKWTGRGPINHFVFDHVSAGLGILINGIHVFAEQMV